MDIPNACSVTERDNFYVIQYKNQYNVTVSFFVHKSEPEEKQTDWEI